MAIERFVISEYEAAGPDRIFGEAGTAIVLGMKESRLKSMRESGKGPVPYREFAATAWYQKSSVEQFRQKSRL